MQADWLRAGWHSFLPHTAAGVAVRSLQSQQVVLYCRLLTMSSRLDEDQWALTPGQSEDKEERRAVALFSGRTEMDSERPAVSSGTQVSRSAAAAAAASSGLWVSELRRASWSVSLRAGRCWHLAAGCSRLCVCVWVWERAQFGSETSLWRIKQLRLKERRVTGTAAAEILFDNREGLHRHGVSPTLWL